MIKKTVKDSIGILGGTFDPIHHGHLRMGLELYMQLGLSRVHLIPCYQPVHRQNPEANVGDRLQMVHLAADNEPAFYVNDCEIKRQKPSFSIDTLIELRKALPETSLCLFVGVDAFLGFLTWHRYQEILNFCHLVIVHRPDFTLPSDGPLSEFLSEKLQTEGNYIHQHLAGGIIFKPITALNISASSIRKQFANGENPRYLLPDSVYDYIKQRHIYGNRCEKKI